MQHTLGEWYEWPLLLRESLQIRILFFVCLLSFNRTIEWKAFSWSCSLICSSIFIFMFLLNLIFLWQFLCHFGYLSRTVFVNQCLILPVPSTVFIEYLLKEKPKKYVHRKNKISWNIIYNSKVFSIFHSFLCVESQMKFCCCYFLLELYLPNVSMIMLVRNSD